MQKLQKSLTVLPRPGGLHAAVTSLELAPKDARLLNEAYRSGGLLRAESDRGEVQCMVSQIVRREQRDGSLLEGFTLDVVFEPDQDALLDSSALG